ncbi:CP2-domain-containing protein [Hesseltinella vesiculosa]|uniref:CP2-domain-containing protein n=1 Tax=Hesseltinella vesiculosa TaxID=101127 RepID=A0A1X2G9S8_9FUNG|nr:CP2-domain-containing protein [Hesseltinella vesiculosa]
MLASELCTDSFYDNQYGSTTMTPECKSEGTMIDTSPSVETPMSILTSTTWISSPTPMPVASDFLYTSSMPPLNSLYTFPATLPPKNKSTKRHPRHHSANSILQQYSHPVQPLPYHHHRQSSTSPSMVSSSISTHPSSNSLSSKDPIDKSCQRCHIILQAATAANQRNGDATSLTYLNRGQAYGIQFRDKKPQPDTVITSTVAITFHDASHRQAAHNYWRFWLSQQDHPSEARALDLDTQQSSGLVHVQYPSFDRITIQWQSQVGATIYVRFNCLSTDFSRIKGVKGIPLRAYVETSLSSSDLVEKSFCKVKLFRDKGAERKNKDDAKQISKQIEKLKAEGNNTHLNPLWQLFNRPPLPYTNFEAVPEDDDVIKDDYSAQPPPTSTTPLPLHSLRADPYTASSPTMLIQSPFLESNLSLSSLYPQTLPSTMYHHNSSFVPLSSSGYGSHTPIFPTWSPSPTSSHGPQTGMKRSRSHLVETASSLSPTPEDGLPVKKQTKSATALTLFVDTKKDISELKRVELEEPTVEQLIHKLSSLLHLQPSRVSEVLWRRDPSSSTSANMMIHHFHHQLPQKKISNSGSSNMLVLVEDSVLEYFPDQTIMSVEWEISSSGLVRLILEF